MAFVGEQASLHRDGSDDHEPHGHGGAVHRTEQPRQAPGRAVEHDRSAVHPRRLEGEEPEQDPEERVRHGPEEPEELDRAHAWDATAGGEVLGSPNVGGRP